MEKMDFGKFGENWKNRQKNEKIIFSHFLQDFWREKMDLGKIIWWKLKKSPQNHFFGLSAVFLKEKNGLWKIFWKLKKSLKNNFFGLSAGFLKGKMDFGKFAENWKNRSKIIFSDFLQDFWREKWILKILLIIQKITPKSFFRTFCRISEGKK